MQIIALFFAMMSSFGGGHFGLHFAGAHAMDLMGQPSLSHATKTQDLMGQPSLSHSSRTMDYMGSPSL